MSFVIMTTGEIVKISKAHYWRLRKVRCLGRVGANKSHKIVSLLTTFILPFPHLLLRHKVRKQDDKWEMHKALLYLK